MAFTIIVVFAAITGVALGGVLSFLSIKFGEKAGYIVLGLAVLGIMLALLFASCWGLTTLTNESADSVQSDKAAPKEFNYCPDCGSWQPTNIVGKSNYCYKCGSNILTVTEFNNCPNCGFALHETEETTEGAEEVAESITIDE